MDPTYELALAVITTLRANTDVAALVENKLYDRVPERQTTSGPVPDVTSPYISMGPVTAISDDADCIEALEITFQIDAWSWGGGEAYTSVQVRKIAHAVRQALHNAEISLTTNALATLRHELTRIMRDPDGITNHAAVQFTAVVEIP